MSEETATPAEPTTEPAEPAEPAETEPTTTDGTATDWQAEAARWKSHSRRNEDRAKAHAAELDAVKASVATERAVSDLRVRLAYAGMDQATASGLLGVIDASKLLTDGQPNGEVIEQTAKSLARSYTVVNPDPDHGRKDNGKASSRGMGDLIQSAISK